MELQQIQQEFPQLKEKVRGKNLVYLDNAATTLKPLSVIEAVKNHYSHEVANIHRGIHFLAESGTEKYEASRQLVKKFLNTEHAHEVIFTKGTTDSINLVAQSFGSLLKPGDQIILTPLEHHSNIVPWQFLREKIGIEILVTPINSQGEIILEEFEKLLSNKVKLVAFTLANNSLGVVTPAKQMIQMAHAKGAVVLVDAAQSIAHLPVDVRELDCDFLAFSGHKIFAPTGIGVLYGKEELLKKMPPYQGGGDMIDRVTFAKTTYNDLPFKFEAGTPHICGGIALKSALEFVLDIGFDKIQIHERELLNYAQEELQKIEGLTIYGNTPNKVSVVSFNIKNIHPSDVGTLLDQQGLAVRAGHHCNQPLMDWLKTEGTVRASFSLYNTQKDVNELVQAVKKAKEFF